MDLKDLDRIHKEQADRNKFRNVLQRFDEGANLKNVIACVVIVVGLVFAIYGIKEMNWMFQAVETEQVAEETETPVAEE